MIPNTEEKERELVVALRNGTSEGQRLCYEHYYSYLTAVCSRYLASDEDVRDILQEIFIKAFAHFDKFSYLGPGSLQAWIRKIAVNEALMLLRSKKKHIVIFTEDVEKKEAVISYPDDPEVEDIPPQVLLDMIRKLPERYRTVFNLFVFEDKSHREIAALLRIKEDSSASNLHRAKALLVKWIKEYKQNMHNG